jgi:hypothetical protein
MEKLHYEELLNMCSLPDIAIIKSRRMRWMEQAAYVEEKNNAVLKGSEGWRLFERPRREYEDNNKMDHK